MKKNIFLRACVVFSFFLSLFYFISCHKKDQPNSLSTSTVTAKIDVLGFKVPILSIIQNNISFSSTKNESSREVLKGLDFFFVETPKDTLSEFLLSFVDNFGCVTDTPPHKLTNLIFFTHELNGVTNNDSLIALATIQSLPNNKLDFKLFMTDKGCIKEDTVFRAETSYFVISDIYTLAKHLGSRTCLFFEAPSSLTRPTNHENFNDSNMLSKMMHENIPEIVEQDAKCTSCGGYIEGVCTRDTYGVQCSGGGDVCPKKKTTIIGLRTGAITDTTNFRDSRAYFFRDSLLENYAIGKKYISYYYKLAAVEKANRAINLSSLSNHINLGIDAFAACERIVSGSSTDTILTTTFKSKANAMINYYKTLTTNLEVQSILYDMEQDLNTYHNLTRQQLLTILY